MDRLVIVEGVSALHIDLAPMLATDDPCVADEMSIPTVQWNSANPAGREHDIEADFSKRITEDFGITDAPEELVSKAQHLEETVHATRAPTVPSPAGRTPRG
jgi:hypothetical protein